MCFYTISTFLISHRYIFFLFSYKLVIRARDRGTPALETDIVFRVIVDDVNEHEPKFDRLLTTSISEDTPVGNVILKVNKICLIPIL